MKSGFLVLILISLQGFTECLRKNATRSTDRRPVAPRWWDRSRHKPFQTVRPGNIVRLPCPAGGFPAPTITWSKNGKPLRKNSRIGGYKMRKNGRLILTKTRPEDRGVYNCTATNHLGSIQRSYELQIPTAARPLISPPSHQRAYAGENVTLECRASWIQYTAHMQWRHQDETGNAVIVQGPRMTVSQEPNGDKATILRLEIQSVTEDDTGSYTCVAANIIGMTFETIWLHVRTGERVQPDGAFLFRELDTMRELSPAKRLEFAFHINSLLEKSKKDRPENAA